MNTAKTLLALAAIAIPAFAGQYSLDLRPRDTHIEWTLGDVLHIVHGTFNLKRGRIDFDTSTRAASGEVIVDIASGASGSAARDRKMHQLVLESAKYPEAVFTPDRFEGTLAVPGTSEVKVHGTLVVHGTSHEITMRVQTSVTEEQLHARISFELPYVAWGMKDPSNFLLKVNKVVQVSIDGTGTLKSR